MKTDKPAIFVTGGAGYIGSHIVKELCDKEERVIVFDNLSTGFQENVDERAELIVGDIANEKDLDKAFSRSIGAVIHLAARKDAGASMKFPAEYSDVNVIGTLNVLKSMLKSKVFNLVFSSTAAVYGNPEYLPIDEYHPLVPSNYYGFTKLITEETIQWYAKIANLNFCILRYFNAVGYGSGKFLVEKNPSNLLPKIIETVVGKRSFIEIYGNDYDTNDGTGVRDYIHISDLSSAHISALQTLEYGKFNQIINLGARKGISVLELIRSVEKISGKKIEVRITDRRDGDVATVIASSDKAKKLWGWNPKGSDVQNIVKTTLEQYK